MQVKHLGPFTGRQLTTVICVVIAAVAFPVGAFAVSGSNTFITDATSGKRAKVDATGNLQTKSNTLAPTATRSFYTGFHATSTAGQVDTVNLDHVIFLHIEDFSGCDDIFTVADVQGVHLSGSAPGQEVHLKYVLRRFQNIDVQLPSIRVTQVAITKGGSCDSVGDYSLMGQ